MSLATCRRPRYTLFSVISIVNSLHHRCRLYVISLSISTLASTLILYILYSSFIVNALIILDEGPNSIVCSFSKFMVCSIVWMFSSSEYVIHLFSPYISISELSHTTYSMGSLVFNYRYSCATNICFILLPIYTALLIIFIFVTRLCRFVIRMLPFDLERFCLFTRSNR